MGRFKAIVETIVNDKGNKKVILCDCLLKEGIDDVGNECLQSLLRRQFDFIADSKYIEKNANRRLSYIVFGEIGGSKWFYIKNATWEGSEGVFKPDDTAATMPDVRDIIIAQLRFAKNIVNDIMSVEGEKELDETLHYVTKQMNKVMEKKYVFIDSMFNQANYAILPKDLYPNFITIGFGLIFIRINLNSDYKPVDYILFNEKLNLPNSCSFNETLSILCDKNSEDIFMGEIPSFFYQLAGKKEKYINELLSYKTK